MGTHTLKARKHVFVENMRLLIAVTRLNLRELAERSGLGDDGYRWLRRAARIGIHKDTKANRHWLNKLIQFLKRDFRISSVEDFWNEKLIRNYFGRLVDNENVKLSSLRTTTNETKQMLEELLNTHEFEYLRNLVTDLHYLRFKGQVWQR